MMTADCYDGGCGTLNITLDLLRHAGIPDEQIDTQEVERLFMWMMEKLTIDVAYRDGAADEGV